MKSIPDATDLPVLLPAAERLARRAAEERCLLLPRLDLDWRWGVALAIIVLLAAGVAEAQSVPGQESVFAAMAKWAPLVGKGFLLNIAISLVAITCGTVLGLFLGLAQISLLLPVRAGSWFLTQFFRNAPWLVLLFYCIFMLP